MLWRSTLLTGAGAAFLMLALSGEARADHGCWHKVAKEEEKLDREVRKHGWYSRQAEHRRARLHSLRVECSGGFSGSGIGSTWRGDRSWRGRAGRFRWDRRLGRGFDHRCDRNYGRGRGHGRGWRR